MRFQSSRNLIDQLLNELRPPTESWLTTLRDCWAEVVGEAVAANTQPDRIEGQTLIVRVANHLWQAELRGGLGRIILSELRRKVCADIKNIRWVLK